MNSQTKKYHTSGRADKDIKEIYKHTVRQYGFAQGHKYLEGLYTCFAMLGLHPDAGHAAVTISKSYRRFEYESHVIFYKKRKADIWIIRVLHEKMDAGRHL